MTFASQCHLANMGWRERIYMFISMLSILWVNCVLANTESCQRKQFSSLDGDVIFGATFNIHKQSAGTKGCSEEIHQDAVQRLEAAHFAVKKLNEENVLPGITFGIRAYDDCGLPEIAVLRGIDYLSERENYVDHSGNICPADVMFPGMLSSLYSGVTARIAQFLNHVPMPTVSYASHSLELSDTEKYPYFQRLVPSATSSVQVLISLIQELGWSHISLLVGSDPYAQDLKSEFLRLASDNDICTVALQQVENGDPDIDFESHIKEFAYGASKGARGVITMVIPEILLQFFQAVNRTRPKVPEVNDLQWISGLPFHYEPAYNDLKHIIRGMIVFYEFSPSISKYKEYFTSLTPENNKANPFFGEYWEQVHGCVLGSTCDTSHQTSHVNNFQQLSFVYETIASVYTFAHALRNAHKSICKSASLCPELINIPTKDMMKYLRAVEFDLQNQTIAFKKNGEVKNTIFGVKNVQLSGNVLVFNEVGSWVNGELTLKQKIEMYNKDGQLITDYIASKCEGACECVAKQTNDRYSRLDGGDVFLMGIFDAHLEGDEVKECSDLIDKLGILGDIEAFFFGLDQVNQDLSVLPKVQLGGLVLDNCDFNADRMLRQLSRVLLGSVSAIGTTGEAVPMLGAVTGISSTAAINVQRFLEPYKIPQMSHRSSSPLLSDRSAYPHFLRVIGSDVAQAKAMVDIIKAMNWTYVITVFSDSAYGRAGMRQFLRQSEKEGICVATQIMVENYFPAHPDAMENIIQYMIAGVFPGAKVVAMFVTSEHARAILEARDRLLGNMSNEIVWLAGDAWGADKRPVDGIEASSRGAITLDFYTQPLSEFDHYLTNLTPKTNKRNVWFGEMWEQLFQCYLTNSNKYSKRCADDLSLQSVDIDSYQSRASNVIDSVYTYARGLQNLIRDYCPETPLELCRNASSNLDKVYGYMRELQFEGSTGLNVAFDRLGDGIPRYDIYNFQRLNNSSHGYIKVGTWMDGVLDLDKQSIYQYGDNDTASKTAETVSSLCQNPPCKCSTEKIMDMPFHEQYRDFTLLGYFPLHTYQTFTDTCGAIRPEMYQQLLAFYFAIDQINKNSSILPDSVLGFMVWDTCSNPKHGEFVFEAFDLNLRLFNQPPEPPIVTNVMALIGGYISDVTGAISKANQRGYHLVQITPGPTSPELNNKTAHPRATSYNTEQMQALVSLIKAVGWRHISVVYSNASVSEEVEQSFKNLLEVKGICLATAKTLVPKSESVADYDTVITELYKNAQRLTPVVVFASETEIRQLLLAVKRQGSVKRLVWISWNHWTESVFEGVEDFAIGSLTLQPDPPSDPIFDKFLGGLTADSFPNDPWYKEFWEHHFQCSLEYGGKYDKPCRGTESFNENPLKQHRFTPNTINAVYAYAVGVTKLYLSKCGKVDVFGCLDKVQDNDEGIKGLLDELQGADGNSFTVKNEGDSIPENFKVFNYQGNKGFVQIGKWENSKLLLDLPAIKLHGSQSVNLPLWPPMSLPCHWYTWFPWSRYPKGGRHT